jgi:dihydrofolate synthase
MDLTLQRIFRLLPVKPYTWRAVHIAGTNGKGSTCAYVSAMLKASGIRCGRFTSPHLIDRWDCITINDEVVKYSVFTAAEDAVKSRNAQVKANASEFELLTLTAFEIFEREKIEVGVVEVGLGGRLDATNVLSNPLVTVITKIGLDHQALLGNTLVEIAREKAGILKPGCPIVVDATNEPAVIKTIADHAVGFAPGSGPVIHATAEQSGKGTPIVFESSTIWMPHQRLHLSLALTAMELVLDRPEYASKKKYLSGKDLLAAAKDVVWPGRLQRVNISALSGHNGMVLLDGAHNPQAAQVLAAHVESEYRRDGERVVWVLACSKGKNVAEMLEILLKAGDHVCAVEFGSVDGMPWVSATPSQDFLDAPIVKEGKVNAEAFGPDILSAIKSAIALQQKHGLRVVIAGSLYLVSDVLRLLREANADRAAQRQNGAVGAEDTGIRHTRSLSQAEMANLGDIKGIGLGTGQGTIWSEGAGTRSGAKK